MNIPESFLEQHPLYGSELEEFFKINQMDGLVISKSDPFSETDRNIIFNLDDDGAGTHWVALFVNDDKAYYFDSFGVQPPDAVLMRLKGRNKRVFYSDTRMQPDESILCGYYCAVYLYWMNRKADMYDFIYQFGQSGQNANDKLLEKIIDGATVVDTKKGAGVDLVDKLGEHFEGQEWHLRTIQRDNAGHLKVIKHNWTGPFSDNEKKISNWDDLRNSEWDKLTPEDVELTDDKYRGVNSVDRGAMMHDIAYDLIHRNYDKKDQLEQIHKADEALKKATVGIMKDSKENITTRTEAGFVSLVMALKVKLGLGKNKDEFREISEFVRKHQEYLPEESQAVLASLLTES